VPAGLTPEDIAVALGMPPADLETGSDDEEVQEQVPSKKSTSTTSKSSKKKADQLETEYKKASEHPDLAKLEKSRKRGTTEGPEEGVNSPKKVRPFHLSGCTN
jgi:cell envelope opacity-associated protein A